MLHSIRTYQSFNGVRIQVFCCSAWYSSILLFWHSLDNWAGNLSPSRQSHKFFILCWQPKKSHTITSLMLVPPICEYLSAESLITTSLFMRMLLPPISEYFLGRKFDQNVTFFLWVPFYLRIFAGKKFEYQFLWECCFLPSKNISWEKVLSKYYLWEYLLNKYYLFVLVDHSEHFNLMLTRLPSYMSHNVLCQSGWNGKLCMFGIL